METPNYKNVILSVRNMLSLFEVIGRVGWAIDRAYVLARVIEFMTLKQQKATTTICLQMLIPAAR